MKLQATRNGNHGQRGAALMLSLLVLFVLILIVSQISYSSKTDARVARNEDVLVTMDLAIESVLLQAFEDLLADAESGAAGGAGGLGGLGADGAAAAPGPEGGEAAGPSDSREDEWSRPQRTEMNELQIRVLIQDEDSKFNLLSIMTEDEDEAEKAFERLVRVIEYSRKGTSAEIAGGDARRMATAMQEFMQSRPDQYLPRPELLSDLEDDLDLGLPLTLREFVAIDPELFPEDVFRDFRDEDDVIVHSLSSFLTVHSSLGEEGEDDGGSGPTAGAAPAGGDAADEGGDGEDEGDEEEDGEPSSQGGGQGDGGVPGAGGEESEAAADGRVNVNTSPPAVLKALIEDRDIPYQFWDEIIEFRNEPDEEVEENDDPALDEYGEEVVVRQIFESLDDLSGLDSWNDIEPIYQGEIQALLKTQSSVFSIYVTARRPTGEEDIQPDRRREDIEREEAEGQGLMRTVRSVVWRKTSGDGEAEIIPIIRWEVIDYVPYEVRDFPEEDR